MLKLSIKNPSTQETETYDVATEFNQFFDRAKEYGLINSIFSLKVKDMRAEDAPIRLRADSDIGNGLIRILPDSDSLAQRLGLKKIEDCVYIGFDSSIPQITSKWLSISLPPRI